LSPRRPAGSGRLYAAQPAFLAGHDGAGLDRPRFCRRPLRLCRRRPDRQRLVAGGAGPGVAAVRAPVPESRGLALAGRRHRRRHVLAGLAAVAVTEPALRREAGPEAQARPGAGRRTTAAVAGDSAASASSSPMWKIATVWARWSACSRSESAAAAA